MIINSCFCFIFRFPQYDLFEPEPIRSEPHGRRPQSRRQVQHDKEQRPIVVTGVKQPSVIRIVEKKCKEVGAEVFRIGKDFNFKIKKESLEGSFFDLTTNHDRGKQLNGLHLSLIGEFQVENASLAVETVLQLRKFGFRVSDKQIRKALKTAFFPGRFEVLPIARGPVAPSSRIPSPSVASSLRALDGTPSSRATPRLSIILDGAHNPTKMRAFIKALKKLFPNQKKIFVVGFKFDKDIPKMLKQIVRAADTIIVTEFHGKTDVNINASMKVSNLIRQLTDQISNLKYDKKIKVMAEGKSKAAFSRALKIPKQSTKQVQDMVRNDNYIIAVTGSLYLVGEVREYLFEIASPNKLGSQ